MPSNRADDAGLLHALNPGATVVSTAAIALEAGVLLAAAYDAYAAETGEPRW